MQSNVSYKEGTCSQMKELLIRDASFRGLPINLDSSQSKVGTLILLRVKVNTNKLGSRK